MVTRVVHGWECDRHRLSYGKTNKNTGSGKTKDLGKQLSAVRSALKRKPMLDFDYFSIKFYYIICIRYQKIGDLCCLFHISGLSRSVL